MSKIEKIAKAVNEGSREYRDLQINIVEAEEEKENAYQVRGYATTFNQPYPLYSMTLDDGYTVKVLEQVDADAFNDTDMNDVIMQYDHEGRVFARQSNHTLSLNKDEHGLLIDADLSGTEIGRQLYEEIKGGYTNKMSIGFTVKDSAFEQIDDDSADEVYLRTIKAVRKLWDVSAVSLPANDFTSISARSVCDGVIQAVETERLTARKKEELRRRLNLRIKAMKGDM